MEVPRQLGHYDLPAGCNGKDWKIPGKRCEISLNQSGRLLGGGEDTAFCIRCLAAAHTGDISKRYHSHAWGCIRRSKCFEQLHRQMVADFCRKRTNRLGRVPMTLKYYQNLSQSGSVCQILCYKLVSVSPTGVTLGAFRSLFRRRH